MSNVREATFQLLREIGITTIFGNPGSTEENFLMNYPADFKYVLALQEASVMAIADAYAQATGKPAMVNIHTVVGTGNAMGNPAFPENHPLYQGGLTFAIAPLEEKLRGYDVVVVFGAPVFRYYPNVPGDYMPAGTSLWHITDDPNEAARAPVGDALLSDPALALEALNNLMQGYTTNRQSPPAMAASPAPQISAPLSAAALFATMNKARKEHTVMVEESPSNLADLHKQWKVTEPLSFFTMASGGLGYGLPAAVGVALAEREAGRNRPVVAVIGDGSFQYSIQCLWTAVQHKLQMLIVVPDNAEYAILKAFATTQNTPGVPGLDIPGKNIVLLAQGYGCTAERADTEEEVTAAMQAAYKREGPTVLVVPINPDVPPLL